MSYWVYIHTCPNGKRYVGITTYPKPEYRWQEGRGYCRNKHFSRAIRKYGWNNIKHEAWELTCESEMYYAEKYLIAYYHTTDNKFGYNNSSGGEKSALGCKCSEETRRKISETAKERWSDPEFREKMLEVRKGRGVLSEEARRHLAEADKKKWADPGFREKVVKAMKGKSRSEGARKHIAEASKKRWLDPEYREKMSKVRSDPEYRERISKATKERAKDPEFRKKLSEAIKKSHSDPEVRRKMSEAQKNRPRIKIKLPDGTILEMTKQNLTRNYIKKNKAFQYVS